MAETTLTKAEIWLVDEVSRLLRHNGPLSLEEMLVELEKNPGWREHWGPDSGAIQQDRRVYIKWAAKKAGAEERWAL